MAGKFAIFTHNLGKKSETFISQHILHVNPGKTVVVVDNIQDDADISIFKNIPILALNRKFVPFYIRLINLFFKKVGVTQIDFKKQLIQSFLKKHQVEVVLVEYLVLAVKYIDMVKELGLRFYGHAHGFDISSMLRLPEYQESYPGLAEADGVITINHESIETLNNLGIPREKIHYKPYGVDLSNYAEKENNANSRLHLLAVGRMVGKKAPVLLLQIVHLLKQKGIELKLDYVGDGELMPAAMEYVIANKMGAYVQLHGAKGHDFVLDLMQKADVFVQHSVTCPLTGDKEGMPVAILEAMAYGMPVVSTRHAGIPEAVVEGECGYLVDEFDVEGMAEKVEVLAKDPEMRTKMGQYGRKRVEENFTREHEKAALKKIMNLS